MHTFLYPIIKALNVRRNGDSSLCSGVFLKDQLLCGERLDHRWHSSQNPAQLSAFCDQPQPTRLLTTQLAQLEVHL